MTDARSVPIDIASAERLAAKGLTYRLIDAASETDTEAFLRADARGFLGAEPTDDVVAVDRAGIAERRNIGVFEAQASEGDWPVATVNSWVTPLTVPGGETDMWAISSVTVAGTHRRRGIARAVLEGELRAAASAGVPIAGLTVSEATIYGRYGFAPAIPVARVRINTRRAGWAMESAAGRLEYVEKKDLKATLASVHEQERTLRAGQIAGWDLRWGRMSADAPGNSSATAVRGVRYRDEDGVVRGVMVYTLSETPGDFRFELSVTLLSALTPDALTALWGFAVRHDLVDSVIADLRPIDDPLPWLVKDRRGVEMTVHDHGWLRILDVRDALTARSYSASLDVVLGVEDPLGFTTGNWRLRVGADGVATVSVTSDAADIALNIADLSAIYVGGIRASTLADAGRVRGEASAISALTCAFATGRAPLLGIWY